MLKNLNEFATDYLIFAANFKYETFIWKLPNYLIKHRSMQLHAVVYMYYTACILAQVQVTKFSFLE